MRKDDSDYCSVARKGRGFPIVEEDMDTTTLLIIIVVLLLLGGGWYGRGRWY
jgi:hypothetical protein